MRNPRRVLTPVTLPEAKARLLAYREAHGYGPHPASTLAGVIWPDAQWRAAQGAGAAATRVLKKLGCYWHAINKPCLRWGWMLHFSP